MQTRTNLVERSYYSRTLETAIFFKKIFLSQVEKYTAPRMLEKLFYGPKPSKYGCPPRLTEYSYSFYKNQYGDKYTCRFTMSREFEAEFYVTEYTLPSLREALDAFIKRFEEHLSTENEFDDQESWKIEDAITYHFKEEMTPAQFEALKTNLSKMLLHYSLELLEAKPKKERVNV
jgi:hypothetical protein